MGPLKANKSVASNRRQGISCWKVDCEVRSSKTAPSTPPTRLVLTSTTTSTRSCAASSLRYAPTLASEPGQSATVLVALAWMGKTPVKISEGNVMKLPPPATELSAPPTTAVMKRMRAVRIVIVSFFFPYLTCYGYLCYLKG